MPTRARKRPPGAIPYGYRLGPDGLHLEPVESEQAVMKAARAARAEGLTLDGVATRLEAQGMRSRSGRTFSPTQISRMLARVEPAS